MKKLIELLNKYEAKLEDMPLTRHRWRSYNGELCRRFMVNKDAERMIISKSFGFIKWLVDNDKIRKDIYRPIPFKIKIEYEDSVRYIEKLEDRILMELSIQEKPIEFLVSILK